MRHHLFLHFLHLRSQLLPRLPPQLLHKIEGRQMEFRILNPGPVLRQVFCRSPCHQVLQRKGRLLLRPPVQHYLIHSQRIKAGKEGGILPASQFCYLNLILLFCQTFRFFPCVRLPEKYQHFIIKGIPITVHKGHPCGAGKKEINLLRIFQCRQNRLASRRCVFTFVPLRDSSLILSF